MAELVEVTDPDDPRLADYRDLRDVQLRRSLEAEHGLFLAEGEKVVRRAAASGYPVRSFLMAPRWLDGLADVLETTDAPCYVVSEELAEQVTAFVQELRGADLHKLAGVSETLDWVAALVSLEKDQLDESTVEHTLGVLLKDHDDIESLRGDRLATLVKEAKARAVTVP